MNKVVNLEEILKKYTNVSSIDYEDCLVAMKEACRQSVKRAAENARLSVNGSNTPYGEHSSARCGSWTVSKQSILDTINEIE